MAELFEPARIGTMELRNRLVMPPMGTGFGARGGYVSPVQMTYYARRASGGVGLAITEITAVDALGRSGNRQPAIWDDQFIPGLRELAAAIHAGGAKAVVQLHHCGRRANPAVIGTDPVAPSPIASPGFQWVPREASVAEIGALVDAFVAGARRAREAGFDAVEVHGTHGYLVAQFLSPLANRRTDEYGGDTARRARFALEIVRGIRRALGISFPIIFRLSGTEFLEGALMPDEAKRIAVMLEEAGVDAIHVSGGTSGSSEHSIPPVLLRRGELIPYAAGIKEVVKVPVIAVAGLNNLGLASSVIRDGKADFVAIGRGLLADPDLPNKWREGREREVVKCISCNSCMHLLHAGKRICCLVNPLLGREEFQEEPTAEPLRLLVYGSGPAALECARVARTRGHQVCLATSDHRIEGRWSWLIDPFVYAKTKELGSTGVDVRLGCALSAALIQELRPQVVLQEETLSPVIPSIPGVDNTKVCTADQLLNEEVELTPSLSVLILGGGNVGCEAAMHVARRGGQATIVESGLPLGEGFETLTRAALVSQLRARGVAVLESAQVTAVTVADVRVVDKDSNQHSVAADLVVLALGYELRSEVLPWLSRLDLAIHTLPACQSPRDAFATMEMGAALARQL